MGINLRSIFWLSMIAGCACGRQPSIFTGKLLVKSSGRATQIASLTNKSRQGEGEIELELIYKANYTIQEFGNRQLLKFEKVTKVVDRGDQGGTITNIDPLTVELVRSPSGEIESLRSDEELDQTKLWLVRCFASYWRPTLPTSHEGTEIEFDGENQVKYITSNDHSTRGWLSLKDTVADLTSMPGRESIPIRYEVGGSLEYRSKDGAVVSIEGTKETKSFLASRQVGSNQTKLSFSQHADSTEITPVEGKFSVPFRPESASASNEIALQKQTLGDAKLPHLLAEASRSNLTTKQRNDVFIKLRALFYLDQSQCAKAITDAGPSAKEVVIEALAASGTLEGQKCLAKVLDSDGDQDSFLNHLTLLIPITNLEPSCMMILQRAAGTTNDNLDRRYAAQLIVGSNVRRCLVINPTQAQLLAGLLSDALRQATSEDDRLNLLYAMGNASNANLLKDQEPFLSDPSAVLRAGAVHSLRFLVDDRLRGKLVEMKKSEKDPKVLAKIEEVLQIKK